MNLYIVSQDFNDNYDTFDSVVVAAESEAEARLVDPSADRWGKKPSTFDAWCAPEHVSVRLIGVAVAGTEAGIVLASFNAG